MATNSNMKVEGHDYDRRKELEDFDNTKLGVKGLVDSGITQIPRIFHHPPKAHFGLKQAVLDDDHALIPIIDMSGAHEEVVERIRDAASKFGFFQVINHGVAVSFLDQLLDAVKAFYELPAEEKIRLYERDITVSKKGVGFFSNHDLFYAKAACWRDTLHIRMGPVPLNPNVIPDVCRNEVIEWDKEAKQLALKLMGLLSEGLGLPADKLSGMSHLGKIGMAINYYPHCPEPNKTVGIPTHADPGMLTILVQDQVGGLQVEYDGKWIDLKPVHGAIVVNIGDSFQIISNDEYKSAEHRVCANPFLDTRVSVGAFFSPAMFDENIYGPLTELVSHEKPALYKQLIFSDMLTRFITKELEEKSMTSYFRL